MSEPSVHADAPGGVAAASVHFVAVFDGKQYLPVVLCGPQPLPLHMGNQVLISDWVHRHLSGKAMSRETIASPFVSAQVGGWFVALAGRLCIADTKVGVEFRGRELRVRVLDDRPSLITVR